MAASSTCSASTKDVSKANHEFLGKIYPMLVTSAGPDSNLVFSPFSVSAIMAVARAGAKGNTAAEMETAMAFPKERALMDGYEGVHPLLQSTESFTLEAANRLFVHKKYDLLKDYLDLVVKHFKALPESVDFGQSDVARSTINTWVEKVTRDKIKELLQPGTIDHLTRLVLVNAVYFKGDWAEKFDPSATSKEMFTTLGGKEVSVDMMRITEKYRAHINNEVKCTVLEMPYKGNRLSMLLCLSHEANGFEDMEAKLPSVLTHDLVTKGNREFEVSLPKFKLETTHDLVSNLQALGLSDMFKDGMSDFSGITGNKDLFVSGVVQKAFIEVNEEGSEAAAATAMVMKCMCMPAPPKKLEFNRPFLFAIRENTSGMLLFTGRVVDPTK